MAPVVAELQTEIRRLTVRMGNLRTANTDLQTRVADLTIERNNLRETVRRRSGEQREVHIRDLEAQLMACSNAREIEFAAANADLKRLRDERDALRGDVSVLQREVVMITLDKEREHQERRHVQGEIERWRSQVGGLRVEARELREEVGRRDNRVAFLEDVLARLEGR
jgi:chromosome segregation ATPase